MPSKILAYNMTETNEQKTGPTKSFMTIGPTLHYSHANVRRCWMLAIVVFVEYLSVEMQIIMKFCWITLVAILSGFLASVGGSMLVMQNRLANHEMAGDALAGLIFLLAVVGGVGSLFGPWLAALIYIGLVKESLATMGRRRYSARTVASSMRVRRTVVLPASCSTPSMDQRRNGLPLSV